jgi:hypothetical protein
MRDGDNPHGENLGEIENLLIDVTAGRIASATLAFGGRLELGENLPPVPWEALTFEPGTARVTPWQPSSPWSYPEEGKIMERVSVLARWSVVLLMLGVFGGTMLEAAAPEPLLLTGEHWQTMSSESKIAYISGVGNLVEYERHQLNTPSAGRQRKSFLPYLARGLSGISINGVVSREDNYYATYPDQLKRPVVDAIFRSVVLPRMRAEKAGGQSR